MENDAIFVDANVFSLFLLATGKRENVDAPHLIKY